MNKRDLATDEADPRRLLDYVQARLCGVRDKERNGRKNRVRNVVGRVSGVDPAKLDALVKC